MIKRIVLGVVAVAAIATAAGVAIVALAYAAYALLLPQLGAPGASAAVAGVAAVLIGLGALVLWLQTKPPRPRRSKGGSGDPIESLVQMARERPVIAAGALIAASVVAIRNPAIAALVAKSFFDSKKPPK